MEQLQAGIERPEVARVGLLFADFPVEGVEGGAIVGIAFAQEGAKETRGGIGFVFELLGGGAAGVHHEDHGKGLLGLVLEDRDLLFDAVIVDFKCVLAEGADRLSGLVLYGGDDAHQIDAGAKNGGLLRQQRSGAEQGREPAPGQPGISRRVDLVIPLSFHPDLAVHEMLLLPDGDGFLQPVDALEGCFEGGAAVRRGDDDGYAGFADQEAPQAMHHGDALHLVRVGDFAADSGHQS